MTEGSGTSPLVASILQGAAPEPVKAAAARGALPLSRPELLQVLVALAGDAAEEIRRAALESLDGLPAGEIQTLISEDGTPAEVLSFFLGWEKLDPEALASLAANPSTPEEALIRAAEVFPADKLDVLLQTQTRLIQVPRILDAMAANPSATPLHKQKIQEIRRHFLESPPRRPAATPGRASQAPGPSPGSEPSPGAGDAPQDRPLPPPPGEAPVAAPPAQGTEPGTGEEAEDADGAHQGAYERVLAMNVTQKVALASRGDREERMLLIRDSNRSVQVAVIGSPKLTESEVEQISKMRNVKDEVLRKISTRRDWMKNMQIVRGLATNPKTPLPISLTLLKRLQVRDLRIMITDRNLPDTLRRMAKKTLDQRLNRG